MAKHDIISNKNDTKADDSRVENGINNSFGNSPETNESDLVANNRVITSIDQAINLAQQDINDARKLIIAAEK